MSAPTKPLPIIIVGAGLVGLTLAQSLRQQSIPFEIYERDYSIDANTRGWGVTIHWALSALRSCVPPELFARLPEIQVDPEQGVDSDAGKFQYLNIKTGETKFVVPPSEKIRINRRKFRVLLTEGIDVKWDKAITAFQAHPEKNSVDVDFHDGTKTPGCLLVCADGSASRSRRYLMGDDLAKHYRIPVGLVGVTLKLTTEQIKPIRDIDPLLFNGCHPETNNFFWYSVQSTPASNGSAGAGEYYEGQFMFSWLIKSTDDEPPSDSKAIIAKMKAIGRECDARICAVMDSIPTDAEAVVINLTDWPTVPWDNHGGLVTLIGDAAHPMTMYRGEGANHGLADAASLSEQIAAAYKGHKTLAEAVEDYETEMQPRGHAAVLLSRQASLDAHDFHKMTADSPLVSKRARVVSLGA